MGKKWKNYFIASFFRTLFAYDALVSFIGHTHTHTLGEQCCTAYEGLTCVRARIYSFNVLVEKMRVSWIDLFTFFWQYWDSFTCNSSKVQSILISMYKPNMHLPVWRSNAMFTAGYLWDLGFASRNKIPLQSSTRTLSARATFFAGLCRIICNTCFAQFIQAYLSTNSKQNTCRFWYNCI